MADEFQQAPRAQHQTTAPSSPPPAEASPANFSRPTTSQNPSASQNATMTSPPATSLPTAIPATAQPAATEEPQTLNQRLNDGDRYWKFKGGFVALAIILGLVGIGTMGWCFSTNARYGDLDSGYAYGYGSGWGLWPSLLTFSVSIVWCFILVAVFVVRKRPVHPGLRVAIDLILWLGFLGTALLALASFMELTQWGEYDDLGGYGHSSSGGYEMASNGTWVWQQDNGYSSGSYTRGCEHNSTTRPSYYYNEDSYFSTCAEQDAYINKLWQEKPHRESVMLAGVVCQFAVLLIHFVLFVWACVDTHRYNRTKVSNDAEKLAANIVQTMITNGAIVPPPGQAHMRNWGQQPMGYYQLPPGQQGQGQAYPMQAMYPQQQMSGGQQGAMQAGSSVAGPSNEKSEGPRYM